MLLEFYQAIEMKKPPALQQVALSSKEILIWLSIFP
jgi:hypothetical protein